MSLGNLGNMICSEDRDTVDRKRNPPEFEDGYGGNSSSAWDDIDTNGGMSDLFSDDIDSLFNSSSGGLDSNNGFDSSWDDPDSLFSDSGFGGNFSNTSTGSLDSTGFDNTGFGNFSTGVNGNNLGQVNQQVQNQYKPDAMDSIFDIVIEGCKKGGLAIMNVTKEIYTSFKTRNIDDLGYLSRNLIITGLIVAGVGLITGIAGSISMIPELGFKGISSTVMLSGTIASGFGLFGIGATAFALTNKCNDNSEEPNMLENIPEIEDLNNHTDEYEDSVDSLLDDFMDESWDEPEFEEPITEENKIEEPVFEEPKDSFNNFDTDNINNSYENDYYNTTVAKIDYNKQLENVNENRMLTRQVLYDTFKNMLPKNSPNYDSKQEILPGTDDFNILETICLKALANVAKMELEDVNSRLESAYKTMFCYELRIKRIKQIKNPDELARELEVYMREDSSDKGVSATVDVEGDFYKAVVLLGTEIECITIGDIIENEKVKNYILDTKHKLPVVTGITKLGKLILDDAADFHSMMITGMPRSGKSWFVLGILIQMILFNTPEDVEFVFLDPKQSTLFNTLSLFPHVIGLHNENVLEIMDDLITNEGDRRKKLLTDNRCEDIWALRDKGIKLPVIYLVIDEYITVRNSLTEPQAKELNVKLLTMLTQLPSLGIRVLFIPHRAVGIVDKSNRAMIHFTACVHGQDDEVKEALGIKTWGTPLTRVGDIAYKSSSTPSAEYIRGLTLSTSNEENVNLMTTAAKAFYKMGVDIPDNSTMEVCYNRDEENVKEQLMGTETRIQYNTLDNGLDDM